MLYSQTNHIYVMGNKNDKTIAATDSVLSLPLQRKIIQLQQLGIIEGVTLENDQFHDTPYQFLTKAGEHGFGSDFFNIENSVESSLGEAVERYLWFQDDSFYRGKLKQSTYRSMKKGALNPFTIVGFSEKQRKDIKKISINSETVFSWIKTESLAENKSYYAPISLFSEKFSDTTKEPLLRWPVTTGQATAPTLQEAQLKSVLEIIERDAFMVTYLNKIAPDRIDLAAMADMYLSIAHIQEQLKRYNIEGTALYLPSDYSPHVVLVVLQDPSAQGPGICVGACAHFNIEHALTHAFSEAFMMHDYLRKYMFEYSVATDKKLFDRTQRLFYWADHTNRQKLDFLFTNKKIISPTDTTDSFNINSCLSKITNDLKTNKHTAYSLELTNRTLQKIGYRTVMTVVPEMQPMHLYESIPYFTGKRLHDIPIQFGFTPLSDINKEPHPFP